MFAKICVAILGAVIVGVSIENAQYFSKGFFSHLVPMALVCCTAWTILRTDGPPRPKTVLRPLIAAIALAVSFELAFDIYKRHAFDENGIVTLLSVCQLLLIGFVSLSIWKERNGPGPVKWKDKTLIWLIMGVGFLFLALDEKVLIHEGLDRSFHKIFEIQATGWTSRIDDFLIGVYGLIGLAVLWFYSAEIRRFKLYIRFLAAGFAGLFLCVVADAATSRPDFFNWLLGPESSATALAVVGSLEEIGKVTSEALFLTGFTTALRQAKDEPQA